MGVTGMRKTIMRLGKEEKGRLGGFRWMRAGY